MKKKRRESERNEKRESGDSIWEKERIKEKNWREMKKGDQIKG